MTDIIDKLPSLQQMIIKMKEWLLAVTVVADGVPRDRDTAEQLRDHLRESFPSWMLPEYWTFVDSIDKTSVGKLLRDRKSVV